MGQPEKINSIEISIEKNLKDSSIDYRIANDTIRNKLPKAAQLRSDKAQSIAQKLKKLFNAPDKAFDFFLKCGWRLNENFIWNTYEQAMTKRKPLNWFIVVCSNEMKGVRPF